MMSSGMAASSWCMRQSDSCDSLSSDSDTDTESESESLSGSMKSFVSACTVDAGTVLGCEKTKNSYITKDGQRCLYDRDIMVHCNFLLFSITVPISGVDG